MTLKTGVTMLKIHFTIYSHRKQLLNGNNISQYCFYSFFRSNKYSFGEYERPVIT